MLSIEHKSMARVGDEVVITATVEQIDGNELICTIEATCNNQLVAGWLKQDKKC
jgi:acyl-CoA thioesterase FadM